MPNMKYLSASALALLVGSVTAKTCINQTVPVTISAREGVFNIAVPQTNLDATTFVQNMTQQGRNFTNVALAGYDTVSGTYNISTEYCVPGNGTPGSAGWGSSGSGAQPTLQILTHGIGFDKIYWDLPIDGGNYSYVDVATDNYGYATMFYDRLGIANSSHGEPLNEIQSFLEVAALKELTTMLRDGTFPGVKDAFEKIVHVGHSFGSAQSYALTAMYPNITDGLVLTGFSMNASFVGYFAAGANFIEANENGTALADYPNGYLVSSDIEAQQYLFFSPPYFSMEALSYAEATKQPVTVGELLTLGSLPMVNTYAGPVLVINGQHDLPYCGGNCLATGNPALSSIQAAVAKNFPNVTPANFEAYTQPNTGHGINLAYNATGAYDVIQEFLAAHGLESAHK